jgi:hypothetical protein
MAQVMEPHGAHAGIRARGLEAASELGAVERPARLRVGKDEDRRRRRTACAATSGQLAREPIGHQH